MSKVCGVYEIRNKINGKRYIGSSMNIFRRFAAHKRLLLKNKHFNIHLQSSYNKHNIESFEFNIICFCDKSMKLHLEQIFIDTMKPEFNIALFTTAPMQGRKYSKEAMEKRRTSQKYIKAMEQLREKVEDCRGNIFNSLTECAEFYNVSSATVCDVLKGRSKSINGKYKIKYLRDSTVLEKMELRVCIKCDKEIPLINFPKKMKKGKYIEHRHDYCINCRDGKSVPHNHWTLENCKLEALKYEYRSEFQKQSRGAYTSARINGYLEECCKHMKPKPLEISEEFKANLRQKFSKKVKCSNGVIYDSGLDAAKATNMSTSMVSLICRKVKKSYKGYSFSFYIE